MEMTRVGHELSGRTGELGIKELLDIKNDGNVLADPGVSGKACNARGGRYSSILSRFVRRAHFAAGCARTPGGRTCIYG
jgi:hypothetical protein